MHAPSHLRVQSLAALSAAQRSWSRWGESSFVTSECRTIFGTRGTSGDIAVDRHDPLAPAPAEKGRSGMAIGIPNALPIPRYVMGLWGNDSVGTVAVCGS
jgi:hypothetical protein